MTAGAWGDYVMERSNVGGIGLDYDKEHIKIPHLKFFEPPNKIHDMLTLQHLLYTVADTFISRNGLSDSDKLIAIDRFVEDYRRFR